MQIGNYKDPGLQDLLTTPRGKMILPPEYAASLTLTDAKSNGYMNITAGVGYLLQIAAHYQMVESPPAFGILPPDHDVFASDRFGASSLMDEYIRTHKRDPAWGVSTRGAEQERRMKKPKKELAIVGWRPIDAQLIARHWNGGGDGNYFDKIELMLRMVWEVGP